MNSDKEDKKHKLFEDTDKDDDDDMSQGYHLDEYGRFYPHYPREAPTPIKQQQQKPPDDDFIRVFTYNPLPPKKFACIETEPILSKDGLSRRSILPIRYTKIWNLTKELKEKKWDADKINIVKDIDNYPKLTTIQKSALRRVMIDLTNREGLINENITENFAREITAHELKHFFAEKCTSNNDHDLFYSHYIENIYAQDPVEQMHIRFLDDLDGKTDDRKLWIQKWSYANQRAYAERLIASIAMEQIFNITNKAVLEKLGMDASLPGLLKGKAHIDDQQLTHYRANLEINNAILIRNASPLTIREIIQNATEFEMEYAQSMNHYGPFYDDKKIIADIKTEADKILQDLNTPKIYNIYPEKSF